MLGFDWGNFLLMVCLSGNYDKWVYAGEDNDYLPHWLGKAGYRTECAS